MISIDVFKEHLLEVCYLIGLTRIPDEQGLAIYSRLKNFDKRDFIAACKDDGMIQELAQKRLNMPTMKYFIEHHAGKRMAIEREQQKKDDGAAIGNLLRAEGMPQEARDALNRLFDIKEF